MKSSINIQKQIKKFAEKYKVDEDVIIQFLYDNFPDEELSYWPKLNE